MKCVFTHSLDYSCSGSLGVLESISEVTDRQEYTLGRSAVHHRTHTTHTSGGNRKTTQRICKPHWSQNIFPWWPSCLACSGLNSAVFLNGWWLHPCLIISSSPHINVFIMTLSVRGEITQRGVTYLCVPVSWISVTSNSWRSLITKRITPGCSFSWHYAWGCIIIFYYKYTHCDLDYNFK